MKYYSTAKRSQAVSVRQAVLSGLAPDGGLYMPEKIPALSKDFIDSLSTRTLQEIALEISRAFLAPEVPAEALERIISSALTFDAPLVPISTDTFALELFHGPTFAFKDFGACFMAQLMSHLVQDEQRELNILVATSGDTGGAVAAGFHRAPGIRVFILYPAGKVSPLQEKQLTTLGDNITALQIQGSFDDCQALVKTAFVDAELRRALFLSSANSINIARLIPQSFYYARAWGQLAQALGAQSACNSVFSVPSGNFGNLCAGIIAKKMGIPIRRFVAATNANASFPEYLASGIFKPRPSLATISNAMDVGNPSNFARLLELFPTGIEALRQELCSYSFTDDQTRQSMQAAQARYHYTFDPHGAVALLGLELYRQQDLLGPGVALATAHPGKFSEVLNPLLKEPVVIPEALQRCLQRPGKALRLPNSFPDFKEYLLNASRT